ncbi:MAG: hypothetical protein KIG62_08790, partial [Oscillospiraceae bacterium]|nr:hypothetical protein [Oscillospiraceae bacterium]
AEIMLFFHARKAVPLFPFPVFYYSIFGKNVNTRACAKPTFSKKQSVLLYNKIRQQFLPFEKIFRLW